MNDLNRRLIYSILVTEEGALKTNIWGKKRKREIASAAKAIDKVNQKKIHNAIESSKQEAARIVAAIMSPRKEPQNDQIKEPQNGKDRKEPHNVQKKESQNGKEEEQADILTNIGLPRTFLSPKQHSSTTPEDLSKRWRLKLAQATLALKATTQKLLRSAVMTLARRYQSDCMFDLRRVNGMMSTYTMDAQCKSIHAEKYLQVFGNKYIFVESYPIKRNANCHKGLETFVCKYGAMELLIYDGAPE